MQKKYFDNQKKKKIYSFLFRFFFFLVIYIIANANAQFFPLVIFAVHKKKVVVQFQIKD